MSVRRADARCERCGAATHESDQIRHNEAQRQQVRKSKVQFENHGGAAQFQAREGKFERGRSISQPVEKAVVEGRLRWGGNRKTKAWETRVPGIEKCCYKQSQCRVRGKREVRESGGEAGACVQTG